MNVVDAIALVHLCESREILEALGFAAVAVVVAIGIVPLVVARASDAISWIGRNRLKFALIVFACLLAPYASTKHAQGVIRYLFTDYETRYLIDSGSYVTNDYVHISFARVLVPDNAPFYLDACPVASTNETADTFSVWEGTIGAFGNPTNFPYADASDYNWFAYTTWTPGPSVKTNGVVDIKWRRDNRGHGVMVPIRTGLYDNAIRISPPRVVIEADLSSPNPNGGNADE